MSNIFLCLCCMKKEQVFSQCKVLSRCLKRMVNSHAHAIQHSFSDQIFLFIYFNTMLNFSWCDYIMQKHYISVETIKCIIYCHPMKIKILMTFFFFKSSLELVLIKITSLSSSLSTIMTKKEKIVFLINRFRFVSSQWLWL